MQPRLLPILCLCLLAPSVKTQDARPNILFVFTDDHAPHAIGAYGSRINETPNIDRLAAEGMRFDRCYVGNSICAPSRATILTGKHSHLNGVIDNGEIFDGSQMTFPKLLQKAGYQTAIVGKWHLKSDPTGFDFWQVLIGQGPYYNPPIKSASGTRTLEGYTTDVITDLALDWLRRERNTDKPFLMMYQHKAPHREWAPGPDHLTMYDDVEIPEPATLFDTYDGRTSAAKTQEMTLERHFSTRDAKFVAPRNLTAEQLSKWNAAYGPKNAKFEQANLQGKDLVRWRYQRYIKDYLRTIASVDDNLGRVLDYLDESGLAENTVVIYSSDQGFYLGDHGWYDKRWMYEESFRMPFIIRWPNRIQPGSVNKDLCQNIDFAPTFLDLAGVSVPEEMQGHSLKPLFGGKRPADWRSGLYYHYYEYPGAHSVQRHYGIRTHTHKLIHYYLIDEWELFDLEKDPDELNSLYADPRYEEVVQDLRLQLSYFQQLYGEENPEETYSRVKQGRARERARQQKLKRVLDMSGNREGMIRMANPAFKPIVIGAHVQPQQEDGVLAAHGGTTSGYCLYLNGLRPVFAVRNQGRLFLAESRLRIPTDRFSHLTGVLTADGKLQVLLNGEIIGQGEGEILLRNPQEGLSVGSDLESTVGDYKSPNAFTGELRNLRIYWGEIGPEELRRWAAETR